MRVSPVRLEEAQRRAIGRRREHRAGGEVDADADDIGGVDARPIDQPAGGESERVQVVIRVLQRPIGPEDDVVVGRRKARVDDAVAVVVDLDAAFASVGHVDQHGSRRFRPEVDADAVATRVHGRAPPGLGPRWPDDDLEAAPRIQHLEGFGRLVEWIAVADQSGQVDGTGSGELDRTGQVIGRHPAAELDGQLLAPRGAGREAGPITVGDADQHDPAARPDRCDRVRQRIVVARDLEGDVDRRRACRAAGVARVGACRT